ncbi:hypothetical protein JCM24511_08457 [Saitozyma sp. JCM 24511]|nr:hypothetical protein JCM24511_08457 [Saitozyma sp. JCM 24511]
MATPRKTRSQGPAEAIDLDHPNGKDSGTEWLNVESELAFYASYHSNIINKAIHLVCIPLIYWSSLILLAHLPIPGFNTVVLARNLAFQPSAALILATVYQAYYIALEPIGGLAYLPWTSVLYLTATYFRALPPTWLPYRNASGFGDIPTAVPFGIIVEVFSWGMQFVGHGFFEKRAPALLDNLVQALVLAPFFVHLELLFALFNYKPDLHKKITNKAGVRIRDMNRAAKLKQ